MDCEASSVINPGLTARLSAGGKTPKTSMRLESSGFRLNGVGEIFVNEIRSGRRVL